MRIYLADVAEKERLGHTAKLGGKWHLESYWSITIKKINILKWSIFKDENIFRRSSKSSKKRKNVV